ncbi:hypothetical protein E4U31_004286 [Claviceps sp. LM219 group G6]|nr:hypothetical protein E4U31_004286 [Claviceps sp. LM219 group G6]
MSRSTPRKAPHTRQLSNQIPTVSDYESDAIAIHTSYAPPPPRTNTELNVNVLQRHVPSIHTILSIAANAVVYDFDSSKVRWEKNGIEGTLFVCAQTPLPGRSRPRACVFVLNRRALDNLVVDLAMVAHVELLNEVIILQVEGSHWTEDGKVIGIWIHNDRDETRQVNFVTMRESWKLAQAPSLDEQDRAAYGEPGTEPARRALFRRLSIEDLFGKLREQHPRF